MSFRARMRKRDGGWWRTLDVSRPYNWHGPWSTREEAWAAVDKHIDRILSASFVAGNPPAFVPEADLRQVAPILWPEFR